MVRVQFLGATGTVTGSKYLVKTDKGNILVDCGMFQGAREWRERNWHSPPTRLEKVDAVLLTHAHIDHSGLIPRYVGMGLNCPIYCTPATYSLCKLLLPDSGRIQEEDAAYRRRNTKRSRHNPPLPLYTEKEAEKSLSLFRSKSFGKVHEILDGVRVRWDRMGHILGAASIRLMIGDQSITFSGDIGRYQIPILRDPQPVDFGNLLLIESTYGDRSHEETSPADQFEKILNKTFDRNGVVVIPSFAIGRTQLILYYLRELKEQKRIPDIPVIVDSPMARDATGIYRDHPDDYDEEALGILRKGRKPFHAGKMHFIQNWKESKQLNSITDPMIIISASGMLTGGRVLHHIKHRIQSPLNTILFVGYQPPGGRGAWIKSGAKTVRIFGEEVAIRAKTEEISGLSAHADKDEMLRWCNESHGSPDKVAIVHGEKDSAKAFSETLRKEKGWNTFVPEYLQEIEI